MDIDIRALAIVEEALDRPEGGARDAFVAEACADDAALLARIETLLGAERAEFRMLATERFGAAAIQPLPLPERLGPYRVGAIIGHGGMGTVARAERDDGVFEQTVAVKLIRADIGGERARERFEAERRILGRLVHPGIARILDGGTADGRPWLAMDLVEGLPITQALARIEADRETCIDVFVAVAQAVAHAHRSLVVHADIKPGNVLMTPEGAVKLLDFGIARLVVDLDQAEAEAPHPLTPGYAAPERAGGAAPTVAGDVYSLGALLHEMLTGELPQADSEPEGLPPDLAAIIAVALRSDPATRYPDVASLLADLDAWQGNHPVSARGDVGWRYRAEKFLRRHRTGAAVTGAALLLLTLAATVSTLFYLRAERERDEAEQRFDEVRAMARFMLFDLYDDLADSPGTVAARAQLARTAERYLSRLSRVPDAPPDLRLDVARGWRRLAAVQGLSGVASLGDPQAARRSLDRAAAAAKEMLARDPDNAGAMEEMGWVESGRWTLNGDNPQSVTINTAAERWFARALAADSERKGALLGLVTAGKSKGYDLIWADRPAAAIPVLQAALGRLRAARFDGALARDAAALEVNILGRIGDAVYYAGDVPGSLRWYREQDALVARHLERKWSVVWTDKLGEAKFNLSGALADLPDGRAAALDEAGKGVTALEATLSYGADASLEKRLLILYGQQALVLADMGRLAESVGISARSVALREQRLARAPSDPQRNRDLAVALPNHAEILAKAGDRAGACAAARRAVATWDDIRRRGDLGERDARNDVPEAQAAADKFCG